MSQVGAQVPQRGGRFTRWLSGMLLRRAGWRVVGNLPDLPKFVMIVAPHTSNWDFLYGVCAMLQLDLRVSWIGKHTLFIWPAGYFMRWLGGTALRRGRSEGRVEQTVELIGQREQFILGLAPEGTRKRTARWKTGFYHVAHKAGIPIVLTYIDYKLKQVGIGPSIVPTGDLERDLAEIQRYYQDKNARNPAQF